MNRLSFLFLLLTFVYCARGQNRTSYALTFAKDSVFVEPETGAYHFHKGHLNQSVDLNGDQKKDFIVYFGACGNWGDCIFGFFVAEPSGNYRCVFEEYLPLFKISPSTTVVKGAKWKNITLFERSEDPAIPHAKEIKLFFDGTLYRTK